MYGILLIYNIILNVIGMAGKLFIVCAPSGAGKTTLVNGILSSFNDSYQLRRIITYTSRQPRQGELPGRDYYFVSEREFEAKIEEGFFLEWSTLYRTYYGSPKALLDDINRGISCIVIVDLQGAAAIKEYYNSAILIWIAPPNMAVLSDRLCARGTEEADQVRDRLALAQKELAFVASRESNTLFSHTLVNDDFSATLDQLLFVIKSELRSLER
jgi:guanylate kinase